MKLRELFSVLFCLTTTTVTAYYVGSFRPSRAAHCLHVLRATTPKETEAEKASPSNTVPPDMEAYAAGYRTVFEELPFKSLTPSVGKIPDDLEGSYFRAGPAMFSAGSIVPPKLSIVQPKQPPAKDGQDPDRMVRHPFEGDGAVLGVTFSGDGQAAARFRFVRTIAFTNERKKGQRMYKSMDSTRELGTAAAAGLGNDLPLPLFRHHLQPGLNKNRKNTSNTRAVYWGKKLLTLWEGGQPYKLDALALSTEGRSQLGGAIRREEDPFGGKMVIDSKSDRALFYAVEPDVKKSTLTLYEFNSDFRLVDGGRFETDLPGYALLDDFCATENYAVFVQPSIVADGMKFMFAKEPGKALRAEERSPAILHLIPRAGSKRKQVSIPIPSDGIFEGAMQFCNAYEDGDQIVIDAIRSDGSSLAASRPSTWPWGKSLDEYKSAASKKSLWRYTADLRSGSVTKRLLLDNHCFFGTVNPSVSAQKHRYVYLNVGSLGAEVAPPQGIARFDTETETCQVWMPEPHEFCGEPAFAPRKGKDNSDDSGYILSVLHNGKSDESEIVVLEASNIANGPVTRIPLGIAIPHGLFGCFTASEEANWPLETIERRSKLADKMESKGNMWNEVKSDFSGLGLRFDDMEEYFGDFFS